MFAKKLSKYIHVGSCFEEFIAILGLGAMTFFLFQKK
jgi:hypothetical protein